MDRPLRLLAAAALVTAVCVGIGLALTESEPAPPVPAASSGPAPELADYDTTGAILPRADLCPLIPDEAVRRALGGAATSTAHYGSGDEADLTGRARDVAHEFNCGYLAAGGRTARVWVLAPPVDAGQATRLADSLAAAPGCAPVGGAAPLGEGSITVWCAEEQTAVVAGLLGDAWLSCSLTDPATPPDRDGTVAAAGRWCVDVLRSVRRD